MGAPEREDRDASQPTRSRRSWSTALTVVGVVGVLWGVLHLTSAGYGGPRRGDFASRRPYNQVKRDVHAAFPGALLRAGAGALLILAGHAVRPRSESP